MNKDWSRINKIFLKGNKAKNRNIKDDFEYWSEHNLGVILIIYDAKSDRLFAKKITKEEFAYHKKHSKGNLYPVDFKLEINELYVGEGTFFEKIDIELFRRG